MKKLFDSVERMKLPVFYQYMVEFDKSSVKELRSDARFGESTAHQTKKYLVKENIKSLLDIS